MGHSYVGSVTMRPLDYVLVEQSFVAECRLKPSVQFPGSHWAMLMVHDKQCGVHAANNIHRVFTYFDDSSSCVMLFYI